MLDNIELPHRHKYRIPVRMAKTGIAMVTKLLTSNPREWMRKRDTMPYPGNTASRMETGRFCRSSGSVVLLGLGPLRGTFPNFLKSIFEIAKTLSFAMLSIVLLSEAFWKLCPAE